MKYLVVIEQTATGFSAYSPDVPGCVATGATREDVEREMKEAIVFHLEGLREEGGQVPQSSSSATYVEVAVRQSRASTRRGPDQRSADSR